MCRERILKFVECVLAISESLLSPLGEGILLLKNSLCTEFDWNWPWHSGEECVNVKKVYEKDYSSNRQSINYDQKNLSTEKS